MGCGFLPPDHTECYISVNLTDRLGGGVQIRKLEGQLENTSKCLSENGEWKVFML